MAEKLTDKQIEKIVGDYLGLPVKYLTFRGIHIIADVEMAARDGHEFIGWKPQLKSEGQAV